MITEALDPGAADETAEWEDIGCDDRTGVAASPARQRRAITAETAAEGRVITHWYEDLSKSAFRPGVVRPPVRRAAGRMRRAPRCAASGCCTTTG